MIISPVERMVASEVLPPGSKTSVKKTFALGQSPTTNTKDEVSGYYFS